MSANLQRSLHDDLNQRSLRTNISRYLESFDELVQEKWQTFRELQSYTTGHNLDIMFADVSRDATLIQASVPDSGPASTKEGRDQLAHLMSIAKKTGVYAIPEKNQSDPDRTTWSCFQILGFNPGNRKYMERLTQWSVDDWKGMLSCAVLGSFTTWNGDGRPADDQGPSEGPIVPCDFVFKSVTCMVQPLGLKELFFKNRIDNLHEFTQTTHKTEFDKESIRDLMKEPVPDAPVDDDLVTLVSTQLKAFRVPPLCFFSSWDSY